MIKDMFGVEIKVGDIVLKPDTWGRSPIITQRKVTCISNGNKLYLDDSKVAIRFPERLVVYA